VLCMSEGGFEKVQSNGIVREAKAHPLWAVLFELQQNTESLKVTEAAPNTPHTNHANTARPHAVCLL
jgi:hypothetical protein